MSTMSLHDLTTVLDVESAVLERSLREHPSLAPLFSHDFQGRSVDELRGGYMRLLKVTADFVRYSVPMLRASGEALRGGDAEDRAWSKLLLEYAMDETDTDAEERHGHHIWAINDLKALGAPPAIVEAPPHASVSMYKRFFVEGAKQHPYAVLGAKGVLEHLSIRMCDDLVNGVVASPLENADKAVSFFHHHGVLDIDHVRAGDATLGRLEGAHKRAQVLEGAYFTSGSYRSFLRFCV